MSYLRRNRATQSSVASLNKLLYFKLTRDIKPRAYAPRVVKTEFLVEAPFTNSVAVFDDDRLMNKLSFT
jgi:hypothetical protein